MGVPKLFSWVRKRYPCIVEAFNERKSVSVDNFYLDMNGIIHNQSHDCGVPKYKTEKETFDSIFHYVERLVQLVKPRRLVYLAVDGVAPRAKMNQQRCRRYRTKDEDMEKTKNKSKAYSEETFDSNCITPGTIFMRNLHNYLSGKIVQKCQYDSMWNRLQIHYSGVDVAGEGEHKIMSFCRFLKESQSFEQHSHMIYGADADMLMLGLSLHHENVHILRETIIPKRLKKMSTAFDIIHLSLLREYLDLEFSKTKDLLLMKYDIERIVDDWILLSFLAGNDFIPNAPFLYIKSNALPLIWKTYIETLPLLHDYLTTNGSINFKNLMIYFKKLANYEKLHFADVLSRYEHSKGYLSKNDVSFDNFISYMYDPISLGNMDDGEVMGASCVLNDNFSNSSLTDSSKSDENNSNSESTDDSSSIEIEGLEIMSRDSSNLGSEDSSTMLLENIQSSEEDGRKFEEFKNTYYSNKMNLNYKNDIEYVKFICREFVVSLQWVLKYYFQGCPSWTWFYPSHYSPFISDLVQHSDIKVCPFEKASVNKNPPNLRDELQTRYDLARPVSSLVNLLCLLPKSSSSLLPSPLRSFMDDNSELKDFFPDTFISDINGKQNEWESVVVLPFIDMKRVDKCVQSVYPRLSPEERSLETTGSNLCIVPPSTRLGNPCTVSYHHESELSCIKSLDKSLTESQNIFEISKSFHNRNYSSFRGVHFSGNLLRGSSKSQTVCEITVESPYVVFDGNDHVNYLLSDEAITEMLCKFCYTEWPNSFLGIIVGIRNQSYRYFVDQDGLRSGLWSSPSIKLNIYKEELSKQSINSAKDILKDRASLYFEKMAIRIPRTDYIAEVASVQSVEPKTINSSRVIFVPVCRSSTIHNLSMTKILKKVPAIFTLSFTKQEIYTSGTMGFLISGPKCGSLVEIKSRDSSSIAVNLLEEKENIYVHTLLSKLECFNSPLYANFLNIRYAAKYLKVGVNLLSRLISDFKVEVENRERCWLGLHLRNTKRGLEVPGYTHFYQEWLLSTKCIDIVQEYIKAFPEVIQAFYQDDFLVALDHLSLDVKQSADSWIREKLYNVVHLNRCSTYSFSVDDHVVHAIEDVFINTFDVSGGISENIEKEMSLNKDSAKTINLTLSKSIDVVEESQLFIPSLPSFVAESRRSINVVDSDSSVQNKYMLLDKILVKDDRNGRYPLFNIGLVTSIFFKSQSADDEKVDIDDEPLDDKSIEDDDFTVEVMFYKESVAGQRFRGINTKRMCRIPAKYLFNISFYLRKNHPKLSAETSLHSDFWFGSEVDQSFNHPYFNSYSSNRASNSRKIDSPVISRSDTGSSKKLESSGAKSVSILPRNIRERSIQTKEPQFGAETKANSKTSNSNPVEASILPSRVVSKRSYQTKYEELQEKSKFYGITPIIHTELSQGMDGTPEVKYMSLIYVNCAVYCGKVCSTEKESIETAAVVALKGLCKNEPHRENCS